jgi:hypothetical protein
MKNSTMAGTIVVLVILLLFSLSAAFAGNEKADDMKSVVVTNETDNMTNVANGNSFELAVSLLNNTPMNGLSNSASVNLSINGTVFNDLNGDGLRTKDEPGLLGWTIILIFNGQNVSQNTADNEGRYSFVNLLPGRYTVMENRLAGWNQTYPGGSNYVINLVDKDAVNYGFGNY